MKIKSVERQTTYIIETENGKTYRTDGQGNWEQQFVFSWETILKDDEQLELLFRKWWRKQQKNYGKVMNSRR